VQVPRAEEKLPIEDNIEWIKKVYPPQAPEEEILTVVRRHVQVNQKKGK